MLVDHPGYNYCSVIVDRSIDKNKRYREIVAVLTRHGIGVVADGALKHDAENDAVRAQHVRQAFEELGPVFIKLGQMLSTRADLLPDAYRTQLEKLQDRVEALPTEAIVDAVQNALGAPPHELFEFFDPDSIGSASIGQVHNARLLDGREVVVKVRKPGVEQLVRIDLEILSGLVDAWTPRLDLLQQFDARSVLQEFSDMLLAELDFRREAANQNIFRKIFGNEFGFKVPEIIDALSTESVLTHARVDGVKPGEVEGLSKRRRAAVSRRIARFILEPAFEHGIFYVDPHPGNLLLQENGVLAVVDFGMVQRLTPEARRRVADMLVAIGRCDAERLTYRLIEIAAPTHPIDRTAIAGQLDRMLQRYVNVSFENLPFAEALSELLELFREHRLRLPTNVAQLFKALVMCEGIVRSIDPESGLADYLEPFAGKSAYAGLGGDGWDARLRDSVADAAELTVTLPRRVDSVLSEIERGNLRVWTRVEDVEPLLRRFERVVERANATILAAACIVGLAIVMQFYHPQGWRGWIGFVFAAAAVAAIFGSLRTLFALRR